MTHKSRYHTCWDRGFMKTTWIVKAHWKIAIKHINQPKNKINLALFSSIPSNYKRWLKEQYGAGEE